MKLTESELKYVIKSCVNETLDRLTQSGNSEEAIYLANQARARGYNELADKIIQIAKSLNVGDSANRYEFGDTKFSDNIGRFGASLTAPFDAKLDTPRFGRQVDEAVNNAFKKTINEMGDTPEGQKKLVALHNRQIKQGRDDNAQETNMYAYKARDKQADKAFDSKLAGGKRDKELKKLDKMEKAWKKNAKYK